MMKKTLLSLAMTVTVGLAAVSAHATFLPFTIDETLLGVGTHITTNAGKLNGGYLETMTVDPTLAFKATAFADIGQLFDINGVKIPTIGPNPNKTGLGNQYAMYAIFNSSGVVSSPTTFTGLLGDFRLFLDPLGDSTGDWTLVGNNINSVVASGAADDLLIASSADMYYGLGQGVGSPTSSFIFLFDHMSLTAGGAVGNQYFTDPNPFYIKVNVNGDFDSGLVATAPGTYSGITGDVSANFIPEPGSLALLGLGLAGLGFIQRRRDLGK